MSVQWQLKNKTLTKAYEFPNFSDALQFVNQVGELAEKANHHPDIELSWGRVVIHLSTHSAGGVTDKDYQLAKEIDALRRLR